MSAKGSNMKINEKSAWGGNRTRTGQSPEGF